MPNATAPNAPCVDVWLSPHPIVIPGCVNPSSGPITWTIPCWSVVKSENRIPNSRQFRSSADIMASAISSAKGRPWSRVGTIWSTVAYVRSGNATVAPRLLSMSNACGEVTSWTRCSPIKSCVCPVGSRRTVWRSQTFSRRVLPIRTPRSPSRIHRLACESARSCRRQSRNTNRRSERRA